jgi:protein involved in polysaccharide export with SLBB domain
MKAVLCVLLVCMTVLSCSSDDGGSPGEAPTTYAVNGEVKAPGDQGWKEGVTLSAAIQNAGGITDKAMADSINLIRMKQVTIHDLNKIASGEATDTPLMAGDVILVPRVLER